ncbi:MAG: CBS domain-containing protein, partial [Acetobacteraceae bacterium]
MAASGQRILISDGDRLIGSLSLAAALRATLRSGCSDSTEIGTVDAAPIVYCRENDTLADALRRMAYEDSAHLAVLDAQGRLTGDLSLCDLTLEASAIAPGMREVLRRMT